ncbi:MAG: tetratricopeptide repeat protein [Elusimicrobia bacterium]|nr:tetratricopeptide repeat protein [Elusimicrobiota bacterium]
MSGRRGVILALGLAALAPVSALAAFDDLGAGARAPGMGGAFVAVADDVYDIYYNPAGLAVLTRPSLGASYSLLDVGLTDGSNLGTSFLGYAQPLAWKKASEGTLGLAWNSFSLNNSLYRDDSFYLSHGRQLPYYPFGGDLYLGGSLKYLRSSFGSFGGNLLDNSGQYTSQNSILNGSNVQSAFSGDLGVLYNFARHYSFGAEATNVNQPNVAYDPNNPETLPMSWKLGMDYRSLISNVIVEYDNEASPYFTRESIGTLAAERWFPIRFFGDFGIRGALSLGTPSFTQFAAGISYRTTRFEADYAFDMPINSVSGTAGDQRIALTFRFGKPSEEEESVEMVLEAMERLREGKSAILTASSQGLSTEDQAKLNDLLAQARQAEASAEYKKAVDTLSQAMAIAPSDPNLLREFGRLHFVAQLYPVLPDYKTDPEQVELHQGVLAYVSGDDRTAIEDVSRALAIRPNDQGLRVFFEELQRLTGITEAAKAAPAESQDVAATLTRADAAIRNRQYRLALDLANRVLASQPNNLEAWEDAGIAYLGLRRFDDSLRAWNKAYDLEKSPSMRAVINNYIDSIRRLNSAVWQGNSAPKPSLSKDEIDSLFDQGIDAYTRRDFKQAAGDFRKILDADPTNQEARKALERVLEELKAQ